MSHKRKNPPREARPKGPTGEGSSAGFEEPDFGDEMPQPMALAVEVPRFPPDPAFPSIIFENKEQKDNLEWLKKRALEQTRYLCPQTLIKMGINDGVCEVLRICGLGSWMNHFHITQRDETIEFLSSFSLVETKSAIKIKFRYANTNRSMSYAQFCECFGLEKEPINPGPINRDRVYDIWPKITGQLAVTRGGLYLNMVQHPVLRIVLRFFMMNVFATPNPHKVSHTAVLLLLRFLDPQDDARICLPHEILKNMLTARDGTAAICVGGHITRILAKLEPPVPDPTPRDRDTFYALMMHDNHFSSCHYTLRKPLRWKIFTVDGIHMIDLPSPHLPQLLPGLPHYLIRGGVPQYPEGPRPTQIPPRARYPAPSHQAPSSSRVQDDDPAPTSAQNQPPWEQLISGMNSLNQGMTTLRGDVSELRTEFRTSFTSLDTRVQTLESNFERVAQPWYNWMYRSHMVPPEAETPSFYPHHANRWEVDLSRGLDGLRISEGRFTNDTDPINEDYEFWKMGDHGDDEEPNRGGGDVGNQSGQDSGMGGDLGMGPTYGMGGNFYGGEGSSGGSGYHATYEGYSGGDAGSSFFNSFGD